MAFISTEIVSLLSYTAVIRFSGMCPSRLQYGDFESVSAVRLEEDLLGTDSMAWFEHLCSVEGS